ncbi:hypothetical protein AVEN_157010-1 [Araneus ventricosus]|uniref:Uncharacterized protein n=1 Tax=Araneus ventricosus TaxID=182803 RepID=A0A4Y2TUK7_ARAVE|nr:hypothetical protein AVEN_157010-1 [Araneus ventricosus]
MRIRRLCDDISAEPVFTCKLAESVQCGAGRSSGIANCFKYIDYKDGRLLVSFVHHNRKVILNIEGPGRGPAKLALRLLQWATIWVPNEILQENGRNTGITPSSQTLYKAVNECWHGAVAWCLEQVSSQHSAFVPPPASQVPAKTTSMAALQLILDGLPGFYSRNTVYQAKSLLKQWNTPVTATLNNGLFLWRATKPASNQLQTPRSRFNCPEKIFKLLTSSHQSVVVNAHAGYIKGTKKQTGGQQKQKIYLKHTFSLKSLSKFLRQKMLYTWQMSGMMKVLLNFIYNIIPKVSLRNWTRNEVLFLTGHGAFPSFQRFFPGIGILFLVGNRLQSYAAVCAFTTSHHITIMVWFTSVTNNSTLRRKIHNLLHLQETSVFRPDPN